VTISTPTTVPELLAQLDKLKKDVRRLDLGMIEVCPAINDLLDAAYAFAGVQVRGQAGPPTKPAWGLDDALDTCLSTHRATSKISENLVALYGVLEAIAVEGRKAYWAGDETTVRQRHSEAARIGARERAGYRV